MPNGIRALVVAALATLTLTGGSAAAAPVAKPKITFEKAERIALGRVPGGVVEEIERDRHLGKDVYEVDVRAPDGREHEIVIDANDGTVLSEEIDD